MMAQEPNVVACVSSPSVSSIKQVLDENFLVICRACLTSGDFLMFSLSEVLEKYPIEIPVDDKLPFQICSDCYEKCQQYHDFKLMCVENERYWQSSVEYDVNKGSTADLLSIEMESYIQEEKFDEDIISGDTLIENMEEGSFSLANDDAVDSQLLESNRKDIDWEDLNLNVDVTCPLCPRSAKWSILFNNHLQEHLSSKIEVPDGQIGCPKCYKGYRSKESLLRHIYSHLNCTFGCPKCEAAFGFPNDLLEHARGECFKVSYEIILDDELGCKVCHTTFVSTSDLRVHMENHFNTTTTTTTTSSSSTTSIECDLCGKVFKQFKYLERHRVLHNDRPHKCHLCDQDFVHAKELEQHVRSHDQANHEFVCPVCGPSKRYFLKRSLQAHIDRNHTRRVRNFGCDVCEKRFYDATTLKKHTVTHTGLKPYNCPECDQRFKRPDHLKDHIRRHNLGSKTS